MLSRCCRLDTGTRSSSAGVGDLSTSSGGQGWSRWSAIQLWPIADPAGIVVAGGKDGAGGLPVSAAERGGVEACGSAPGGGGADLVVAAREDIEHRGGLHGW
jgi:hypothetical protein